MLKACRVAHCRLERALVGLWEGGCCLRALHIDRACAEIAGVRFVWYDVSCAPGLMWLAVHGFVPAPGRAIASSAMRLRGAAMMCTYGQRDQYVMAFEKQTAPRSSMKGGSSEHPIV